MNPQPPSLTRRIHKPSIMQGNLDTYPIVDLLQFLQGMRKQFHLLIEQFESREPAGIYFSAGRPVHAYFPPLEGEEALMSLLTWERGRFLVIDDAVPERQTIDAELQHLLLEGTRRLDETRRYVSHKPHANSIPVPRAVLNNQSDDLLLTLREWRILAAIDGRRTALDLSLLLACDLGKIQLALINLHASELISYDNHQLSERRARIASQSAGHSG
jgi:hypothetical protein